MYELFTVGYTCSADKLEVGGFVQVSTVGDPSSIVPRAAYLRVNSHIFGMSSDLIEVK